MLKAIATTCRKHLSSKKIYLSRKQLLNHNKFPSEAQITAENSEGFLDLPSAEEFKKQTETYPVVELVNNFKIEPDFLFSQNIGEWQELYCCKDNNLKENGLLQSKGKASYVRKQIIRSIQEGNLCNGMSRKYGWSLLLGIS